VVDRPQGIRTGRFGPATELGDARRTVLGTT